MTAFLVAVGVGLLAVAGAAQEKAVVYVHTRESGRELRLFRPGGSDALLARLAGPPKKAFWDKGFDNLYYRVDKTVFRLSWVVGASPEAFLHQTPDADELWIDSDTGRWRAFKIYLPEPPSKYLARIYEHRGEQGWSLLVERETHGCEGGDGSTCGAEVQSYRDGRRGVFLYDLHQGMRIASQLDRRGIEFDFDMEDERQFVRSIWDDNVGVELELHFGDTHHGIAPVRFVDRRGGSKKEIFAKGQPGCRRQVSFEEYSRWLLVTGEYTGKCARIVSLTDGDIVWEAPAGASLAAWVPVPRPR